MKKYIVLFCILFLFGAIFLLENGGSGNGVQESLRYHKVKFFEEEYFSKGVNETDIASSEKIIGGVVPHHLLQGFIISDFFKRASFQNPKTIILIGPNHKELGNCNVLTSEFGWDTSFGRLQPDEVIIKDLVKSGMACIDENVLEDEHSVAGLMPYIKYYTSQAKVVPLIISSIISKDDVEKFSKILSSLNNSSTVFVASVDFSHYLKAPEARKKDKETRVVLENFNYEKLYSLGNDHIDSPKSIGILFKIMQSLGKNKFEILNNTNSGDLLIDNFIPTTSYFEIVFYR